MNRATKPDPPCTCKHEVRRGVPHDMICPKGLTMWNDHNRRAANRLGRENEMLRQTIRELRAELHKNNS